MRTLSILSGLVVLLLLSGPARADEWGDLTISFVYDGPAPQPPKAEITKDQEFCGKFGVIDESLLVNKENGGLANVIFFLYVGRGDAQPPVHPDYASTTDATVTLDNNKCRFAPHIVTLRTTQTLEVLNSDQVGHNTNFTTFDNPAQNLLVPSGGKLTLNFPLEEQRLVAAKVACNIHPWMSAWMVVKEHPYMAVSDKDGKITLKNVPAGEWTFQAWHEKCGYLREGKLNGAAVSWSKGRFEHTVKPGTNDLGAMRLSPSLFE